MRQRKKKKVKERAGREPLLDWSCVWGRAGGRRQREGTKDEAKDRERQNPNQESEEQNNKAA